MTHGTTRSWRNGDAQCCQLSNIADPLVTFFPSKKCPNRTFFPQIKKKSVSEDCRYCRVSTRSCCPLPAHAHTTLSLYLSVSLSLCVSSVQREAGSWGEALSVKHRYYIASLVWYDASIAKITALILSLSYLYLISSDDCSIIRIFVQINILEGRTGYVD